MTFVPNLENKNCFVPCDQYTVNSGGCSCHNRIVSGNMLKDHDFFKNKNYDYIKEQTLNPLIDIALHFGYVAEASGYKKQVEDNMHWITFFNDNTLQMYAYSDFDSETAKNYDTGTLEDVSEEELKTLIKLFVK